MVFCSSWLDKLGVSARYGVDVVMRQTFWSHNYGLINDSMLPNPVRVHYDEKISIPINMKNNVS